jgi:NAD(P)-dependent dehydrogenase (short-subunit alcohol dehydrogenase family)
MCETKPRSLFAQQAGANGVDVTVILPAYYSNRSLLEVTAQQWETSQKLNLWAPLVCLREAVRVMTATGRGGSIVTVSTIGSLVPVLRGNSVYGATRVGVTNMTKSMALEHANAGIRVNCVPVGAMEGKFVDEEGTSERRMSGEITGPIREPGRLPMGMGDLGDVAAGVHFLAAPASKYITGQTVAVEGGFLLT